MNIPGIEREEDGTIVIVISETMRLIILATVCLLVVIAIWWVAIRNAESEKRKISRIPGNIPLVEDIVDDPILTEPERIMGVDGPQSNLNLERLSRADREELEKIFEGILSEGVPNLQSEEAQLYSSLVTRSAEIAPNRALQFYDLFEAPSQRLYSIAQLYKKWIEIDAVKAVEVAGKIIEEPPALPHPAKRPASPSRNETRAGTRCRLSHARRLLQSGRCGLPSPRDACVGETFFQ